MSSNVRRELREIVEDADNMARGLFLAYERHDLSAPAYAASLAALYMTALRRVAVLAVIEESS